MAQVTRNSLKGYSYQAYVYILFMTLMDTNEEILSIDAEVGKDQKKHDFDDIRLCTRDKEYLVQVKDYKEFDEEKFKVGNILLSSLLPKQKISYFGSRIIGK